MARLRGGAWMGLLLVYSLVLVSLTVAGASRIAPELRRAAATASTGRALRALLEAPIHYARARLAAQTPPELVLDVKFKALHRLHEKRDLALREGVLVSGPDDWVPASLRVGERRAPVEIRLEGGLPRSLRGDKWSFEVRVGEESDVLGMRRFALRSPALHGFHAEHLFLAHLRREGVLAPRHLLVDLTLNGDRLGLMALEELPSRELLEDQQRTGGAIVRFDDAHYWEAWRRNGAPGPFDSPYLAAIRAVDASPPGEPDRGDGVAVATGLLRGFLEDRLSAAEAFDVEPLARFLAIAELWRATGALHWSRLSFYYDPVAATLSPIAAGATPRVDPRGGGRGLVSPGLRPWRPLLDDPRVRRATVQALQRIAEEVRDGSLLRDLQQLQRQQLDLLYREYPLLAPLDFSRLMARAGALAPGVGDARQDDETVLGGSGFAYPAVVRARLLEEEEGIALELANALPVPVAVSELHRAGGAPLTDAKLGGRSLRYPLELPPTPDQTRPRAVRVRLPEAAGSDHEAAVEGTARIRGQQTPVPFRAAPARPALGHSPVPSASVEKALAHHRFLRWSASSESIYALPGTWDVEGSLVVPEGLGLTLPAGTTLRFHERRGLVARGPLEFLGTEEEPVVLEGRGGRAWAGVVVLESKPPSHWSHVVVRDAAGMERDGWSVEAGVLFRRALVELAGCRFERTDARAALELLHSTFSLRDVEIVQASGTGLRVDFSEGDVRGALIRDAGRAGIQLADSRAELRDLRLEDVRGAALDAAARSRATVEGLRVARAGFAAVSRDGSTLNLRDSTATGLRHVPLLAYSGRSELGPATLDAERNRIESAQPVAVAQIGSRVRIDGEEIATVDADVASLAREGEGG
jgi:hypothetical protein